MMSIGVVKSSSSVYSYFTDQDNYYLSDKEAIKEAATWYGKGAEILGIFGEKVSEDLFLNLLEGRIPNGEQIGQMRDGSIKHRPATDLTFSAPKSVSIMALVNGDKRLLEAHDKAVNAALSKVEALYAEARKTEGGVTSYEKTGNLTIATFRHTTSREMDPQLHTHGVNMNITQREDGKWRALSSRQKSDMENIEHGFRENIYANQHYLGMVYNSTLAKATTEAGYSILVVDKFGNFEIEGISQDYLASVSKRRTQITDMLAEKGLTGAKAAQVAALGSRKPKDEIDMDSLHAYWEEDAKRQGEDLAAVYEASLDTQSTPNTTASLPVLSANATQAVRDAVNHLSQYNVQFSHGDVVRQAFVFAGGAADHEQLEHVITDMTASGALVGKAHQYYTTGELLETEARLKQQFAASKQASYSIDVGRSGLVANTLKNRGRVQIVNVKGAKNEAALVNEMIKTAEDNGLNAFVLHPSRASIDRLKYDVTRENKGFWSAIKHYFSPEVLQTVSGFMQSYPLEQSRFFKNRKNDYIVVLEAQKLSYQDAARLDKMAQAGNGKLVFLNNTQSTQGYRAGNTIKLLADSGIATQSTTTQKQHSLVDVVETKTPQTSLATHFLKSKERPTIVVTTTKAAERITADIRHAKQRSGELALQQQTFKTLSTRGLSDVQKTKTKFYHKGDQVTVSPFTPEQQHYRVVDIDRARGALTIVDKKGSQLLFDVAADHTFEVKKQQTLAIAVGEQLRTTRHLYIDRDTRIDKNSIVEVTHVETDRIQLSDGEQYHWVSDKKLASSFIDYGYVIKPHQLDDSLHVLTALEGYQLNRERIGEITEYAPHVTLFTSDGEKARAFMDKQGQAWTATEVASGVTNRYAPIVRTDETIRYDLETVALALTGNEKATAEVAVAYAMAKLGERECGFEMTKLLEESMKYAIGTSTLPEIEAVVEQKKSEGQLLIGETFVTTALAYALEKKVLANNKEGQGAVSPIYGNAPTLAAHLTQGQKDAVTLALTTKDRFIAIQGWSGTGKTTMMNEFRKFSDTAGFRVIGIAPTHKAVMRLDESLNKVVTEGTEKIDTFTVAKFLQNEADIDAKTVVVVDESSMVSNRMFNDIQERVKKVPGARVMFPGDINQQAAIPSGKPMELSMNNGLKFAQMKEIVRQKDSPVLKSAIEQASQKQTVAALKTLDTINPQETIKYVSGTRTLAPEDSYAFETHSFIEVGIDKDDDGNPIFNEDGKPCLDTFYKAIANDYLHRIPEQREHTFVIATMHDSRQQIDANIRHGLKQEGVITNEVEVTRFRSRNMDTAELLHAKNYQVGDVVRFSQTYSIAKSGDHMFIANVNSKTNQLTLIGNDQHTYTINPAAIALKSDMSVFEVLNTQLGEGDRVRLRNTDVKRGWTGGAEYCVSSITNGQATLDNKDGTLQLDLKKDADKHWDHAYTNTTFSVQGDDDKYAIGAIISDNDRTALIQLSRASQHVTLYTPSKSWAIAQLQDAKKQQQANKTSAYEIVEKARKSAADAKAAVKTSTAPNATSDTTGQREPRISAEDIKPLLEGRIEELAITLLGEPNKRLSNRRQLRFGSKGSLSVNLRTGQWYSHELGEGGGAFELIKHELGMSDFKDVIAYAARFVNYLPTATTRLKTPPPAPKKAEPRTPNTGMRDYARTLFAASIPLKGTLGERYLRESRGLTQFDGAAIRYLPSVSGKIGDKRVKTPGIIAYAFDPENNINHAQVVRLNAKGEKNKDVNIDKQTYGALDGKAVVLHKPATAPKLTYIAEGVETGLSVLNLNRRAHVLATLGVSNFNNIELDTLADKVLLCLDNDGVKKVTTQTIRAAIKKVDGIVDAVKRIQAAGKEVRIAIPAERNTDFNDVLTQKGHSELKTQLHRVFTIDEYGKMAKAYFTDIEKGRLDKMADFDLAESVKKLRIHNKPMPLDFKEPPLPSAPDATSQLARDVTGREPLVKNPGREQQAVAQTLAKTEAELNKQLTREQVENIAHKKPEKTKGREQTL